MTEHALLSASGSAKWLNCPGSIKAESIYPPRETNEYALEGTLAHEIADLCLFNDLNADYYIGKEFNKGEKLVEIDKYMADYVQEYLNYVRSHMVIGSSLFCEQRVDFSNVVPNGFGTLDSAVMIPNEKMCHIFDLKYGQGVSVDAFENTQGMLYAIGLLNTFDLLGYEVDKFVIHIVQPRKDNISYWDIDAMELRKFSEYVAERAKLALSDNAPRTPGEKQCQWCEAKGDCKALAKFTEDTIGCMFEDMTNGIDIEPLSKEEKKNILLAKSVIESFLKKVEADAFESLERGEDFPEHKLVYGRVNRKFVDNVEEIFEEELGEKAYKKALIGIGDAEKLLGKRRVEELTYKPEPPLTLAHISDKRAAVSIDKIVDMF